MKVSQSIWTSIGGWPEPDKEINPQLVLVFGGIDQIGDGSVYQRLKTCYPLADVVLASTAGEIHSNQVSDGTIVATLIEFEHTKTKAISVDVTAHPSSYACGVELSQKLNLPDLKHVLIISDGTRVNGDELVAGINESIAPNVLVTGGLAADSGRFESTLTGLNDLPKAGQIVAVGFYGDKIRIGHGSQGGWDIFGPVRTVTSSEGNKLLELDGNSALELYKKYLGERASQLPGSALLFPLCILGVDGSQLVRTILSINEEEGAMIFAGDIPIGAKVQFMMANFDRLVDGASIAAEESHVKLNNVPPDLVLMISCVGRKIVLDQRVEEEVESVVDVFGEKAVYCGFYSNGEISPLSNSVDCSLHNQTMTITTYSELK